MVINIKNKYILIMFSFFSVFILINTSTAIPQQQSSYAMDKINILEDLKANIDVKIDDLKEFLYIKILDYYPTGIIENLINDNIIFTKEELKEMRFCIRNFKIYAENAQENFPTISGLIKSQLNIFDTIIGKIELLQEYYK